VPDNSSVLAPTRQGAGLTEAAGSATSVTDGSFDPLADVTTWPQFFRSVVHVQPLEDGEEVRVWILDAERETVSTRVVPRDASALEDLKDDLLPAVSDPDLTISFADPLFIGGALSDVYRFLYEADKWPQRVDHVSRIVLTEDTPNVQFFDMDTRTPDGSSHTTRSVRLCFPEELIVYKQIKLPALLDAHTGHWKFTVTREGVVAEARHTATIKPSALSILGPGTTVEDARRYLRRVLSANSLNSLRCAKAYAEERAGV